MEIPSINPLNYKETTVSFQAHELPFLIEAWGSLLLKQFRIRLFSIFNPKVIIVEMVGIDHQHPIKFANNRLSLPEDLLRDVFLMSRNRVHIQALEKRGQHPERDNWGGHSLFHWEEFDRKNAVDKFKAKEQELMDKLRSVR